MSETSSQPLQFRKVAIVGVGLIGGSLGMALKHRRLAHRVVGVGRRADRLEQAIGLGAIDTGTHDLKEGVQDADIVVLCTTVGNILESLGETLALVPDAIVTDVGSTKSAIVRQARGAANFVGGHPMAGSERGGVEAATPLLFQEATWVLTPTADTSPHAFQTMRAFAQELGAATLITTPEAHDAMVAITSHLPHVLSSALMRQAATARLEQSEITRVAAGSFADMTRVSASSPAIWRDVCLSNRDAVLAALSDFRRQLDILESAVDERDADRIEAFFEAGASAKRDWTSL